MFFNFFGLDLHHERSTKMGLKSVQLGSLLRVDYLPWFEEMGNLFLTYVFIGVCLLIITEPQTNQLLQRGLNQEK